MTSQDSTFFKGGKLSIPTVSELGFDPKALKAKYDYERDRRMHSQAAEQHESTEWYSAQHSDDPYTPRIEREPVSEAVQAVILGGGFGGLYMGARLKEAGIDSFKIVERAGDFGGTWYWNRYPGAQCDVDSYIYLPLLEETGYMPEAKYSSGTEIFEHAQRIGCHFELYERTHFQTQVTDCVWSEADAQWLVRTDRGDEIRAKYLIVSSGSLNKPKLPGIPGIRDFAGHIFHTCRWDYDYTGGSPTTPMDRLGDKRVGVIGTGATAVQCVPHLGAAAKHLYVFQRTPSSVDERRNSRTDPEWYKSLPSGWQTARNDNFTAMLVGAEVEEDLIKDGWTEMFQSLGDLMKGSSTSALSEAELNQIGEIVDFQHDNRVRERVASTVIDPDTARALQHWYRPWCKRPCFNDEYLPTFNRPNVTLVDICDSGISRITSSGVMVGDNEYELDCLVFATGFEVDRASYTKSAEMDIIGRSGIKLSQYWSSGMRTFHGLHVHGFPNCFHLGFTQTGYAPNFTYMADLQSKHIAAVISDANKKGVKSMEATKKAEADYVAYVTAPNGMTEYLNNCTPGYYKGQKKNSGFLQGQWPEGGIKFYEMLARWRESGDFEGLEIIK